MKLLLTLLAVCVCTASALVCSPQACDSIRCVELNQENCVSQNAVLKPKATFCGCCPACITQLSMIIIGAIDIITIVFNINIFYPFC